jgi:uncharacterized protein (DUF952 family)
MTLILHVMSRKDWEHVRTLGIYKGRSSHGAASIDCWYPSQLENVANSIFEGQKDLVLLHIESNRVHAKVREEGKGADSHPRIFGPLNLDAVSKVEELKSDKLGRFVLPNPL